MTQRGRFMRFKPCPERSRRGKPARIGGRNARPPASVLGYSSRPNDRRPAVGVTCRNVGNVGNPPAVRPLGATENSGQRYGRSCWHCLQDASFFQYGAQKFAGGGAETAETAQTPVAVHPVSETAKIRAAVWAVVCWHHLQDSNFFQYGAQKFLVPVPVGSCVVADCDCGCQRLPDTTVAAISATPGAPERNRRTIRRPMRPYRLKIGLRGLDPKSETVKLRTVSREERN
jgi:hypothetical protein